MYRNCAQASVNMNEPLSCIHTPRPLFCEPPIQYCYLPLAYAIRHHPRSLAVCDWEGTACVKLSQTFSAKFNVKLMSVQNIQKNRSEVFDCDHSRCCKCVIIRGGAEQLTQAWLAVLPELVLQYRLLLWATFF